MRLNHPLPSAALLVLAATVVWPANVWAGRNEPPDDKTVGKKEKESPPEEKKESASVCVKHTLQARYVNGFDHLVHITNECSRAATCKVSTDVNPEVQVVKLGSGAKTTVLTYRGSPARTFRANVECALDGATD